MIWQRNEKMVIDCTYAMQSSYAWARNKSLFGAFVDTTKYNQAYVSPCPRVRLRHSIKTQSVTEQSHKTKAQGQLIDCQQAPSLTSLFVQEEPSIGKKRGSQEYEKEVQF